MEQLFLESPQRYSYGAADALVWCDAASGQQVSRISNVVKPRTLVKFRRHKGTSQGAVAGRVGQCRLWAMNFQPWHSLAETADSEHIATQVEVAFQGAFASRVGQCRLWAMKFQLWHSLAATADSEHIATQVEVDGE
jgi:hypothetical protein